MQLGCDCYGYFRFAPFLKMDWTVVTDDGLPSAHYNFVAITADGPVIVSEDEVGPWCEMQSGLE